MVLGGWECSGDGNVAVTFELHARCVRSMLARIRWVLFVRDTEAWQLCQFENAILIGGAVEWIVGEQQGAV